MINYLKETLIYNSKNAFNLNSLSANIKSKIDKILRVNPSTGSSYQIWSPNAGVLQFSALSCGEIYVIESNTINYNISNNLVVYDVNLCAPNPTPTPTPTSIENITNDLKVMYIKWT